MGDIDSPLNGLFDGKEHILTFYDTTDGKQVGDEIIADSLAYEVPIAEDSLRFDNQHDSLADPFLIGKSQFDALCELHFVKEWISDNPLTHAQKMIDELNDDLKEFHTINPPRNRKERRKRVREISKKYERLKAYCKKYHIEYEIKKL